jgi:hypothetical protein
VSQEGVKHQGPSQGRLRCLGCQEQLHWSGPLECSRACHSHRYQVQHLCLPQVAPQAAHYLNQLGLLWHQQHLQCSGLKGLQGLHLECHHHQAQVRRGASWGLQGTWQDRCAVCQAASCWGRKGLPNSTRLLQATSGHSINCTDAHTRHGLYTVINSCVSSGVMHVSLSAAGMGAPAPAAFGMPPPPGPPMLGMSRQTKTSCGATSSSAGCSCDPVEGRLIDLGDGLGGTKQQPAGGTASPAARYSCCSRGEYATTHADVAMSNVGHIQWSNPGLKGMCCLR